MKKETLAQVFSCKICDIFKNTYYFCRTPRVGNPTKWSNTLKQFVGKIVRRCSMKMVFLKISQNL